MYSISKSPSVLLVEDQEVLRLGLRVSLERLGCCEVLGEANDGQAAVRETQRLRPEIVLMDVGLPGIDGIEATWRIKQDNPRTRVVMLTSHTSEECVTAALGAGADGYCSKDIPVEQIATMLEAVMRGELWLDPSIASVVREATSRNGDDALSDIDVQILKHVQNGMNNREIAAHLNITQERVAVNLQNIINRYIKKGTIDANKQNQGASFHKWLTALVDNREQGRIFADKYLLEELLGSGGAGAVFKAKHLYVDRFVALKLIRPDLCGDRFTLRSFQREAAAIANLKHKNIVAMYDFGITNDEPFLVMEYLAGINFADIMKEQHQLPVRRLINLSVQICDGLAVAHANGIFHCDLKPSNILIVAGDAEEAEMAKLVDFGLAQVLPEVTTTQSQLTDKFFACGTPLYMSPEQCAGKQLDARSDIYALGCILHEALTGVNTFAGATAMETVAKQYQHIPPRLSTLCAEQIPPQLEYCVSRMLAKDPSVRPPSIEWVRKLLLSCIT